MPAIELEGLTRRYGERVALDDVTLTLPTRARRSSSSAPTAPASRRCCACSRRCCARTPAPRASSAATLPDEGWAVRGRIGFLGHDAAALPRPQRAREPALPRAPARVRAPPSGSRSCSSAVGLRRARRRPRAHALARHGAARWRSAAPCCTTPSVLLLDEPRANLDPARPELRRAAHRRASSGRTRVVTSHDPVGGLAEADLALGLRDGRAGAARRAPRTSTADAIGALYR